MEEILKNLRFFCESEITNLEFAILFGSRALKTIASQSDIDFKIFLSAEASDSIRECVANFAKELNQRFADGSEIRVSDVPYTIKTVVNKSTLSDALNLKAFINAHGNLHIPEIFFEPDFLASQACQMRTVLSALTTPNIFIAGNYTAFEMAKTQAFRSVKKLVCDVYNIKADDYGLIVKSLLESPFKGNYKTYLGYRNNSEIKKHLLKYLNVESIEYDESV